MGLGVMLPHPQASIGMGLGRRISGQWKQNLKKLQVQKREHFGIVCTCWSKGQGRPEDEFVRLRRTMRNNVHLSSREECGQRNK